MSTLPSEPSSAEASAPPLATRVALALAQLGWPDAGVTAAARAVADAAQAVADDSRAAAHDDDDDDDDGLRLADSGWWARLVASGAAGRPGSGESNGCLELWHDNGAWLQLRPDAVLTGNWTAGTAGTAGTAAAGATVSGETARARDDSAASVAFAALPAWLHDTPPLWSAIAGGVRVDHLVLPGATARERLEAAMVIVRDGLHDRAAAAVSTCRPEQVGLEWRTGGNPAIVVFQPAARVCAWVLGGTDEEVAGERVAFVLAARQAAVLHVGSRGAASVSWRH